MNKLACWIKENQLISFFALSFTISWGLLFLLGPLYANGVVLVVPALMLALYGPALAGIILSAILHPKPRQATPRSRLLTFFLTWLLATPIFVFTPESRPEGIDLSIGLVIVAAVIALIPAFIVSSAFSRTPGVRVFLEPLLKPRGSVAWYATAVLIIPALLMISALVTVILGDELPPARVSVDGGWPVLLGLFFLSAAYRFFYANACGEEPGWRGFALPRLQARFNPLIANLILAFFWALWHLPLPQAQGLVNPAAFLEYYVGTFCHCIIIAWLFNQTRGSILVAGLVHVFSNVSRLYIPETSAFMFVRPAFCVVLIVIYRMWEKLPDNSDGTKLPDNGDGTSARR
jgi:membrane protease YdiL (CAAX protease family)